MGSYKTAQGLKANLQTAFTAAGVPGVTVGLTAVGTDLKFTFALPQTISQALKFKIAETVGGFAFNTSAS